MLTHTLKLLVLTLLLSACGRGAHEVVASDCPPPPTCECSSIKAELDALKAKQLAKPAVEEEDERNCNIANAILKDPIGLEHFRQQKAKVEIENKKTKEEIAKMEQDASQLQEPPVELGNAPRFTKHAGYQVVSYANFNNKEKRCELEFKTENESQLEYQSWRYSVAKALVAWQEEIEAVDDRETEGFETNAAVLNFFVVGGAGGVLSGNSAEEHRSNADRFISIMAKSGAVVQWVTGVALRLQPENAVFSGRQLRRLYLASKMDFAKLDKEVIAAENKVRAEHPGINEFLLQDFLPPEYNFAPSSPLVDNYQKGLVLRYWRYKEAEKQGSGKAAVANLQTVLYRVLLGVAAGMKIDLK